MVQSTSLSHTRRLSLSLAALSVIIPQAAAFSFSYSAPTQCGPLTVSWQGGTAPYRLLITPLFNVPINISIPSNAYSNGKGSYTTTIALANPEQFLLTMSDATGLGTGGTSGVLTVADPVNGNSCNTTAPNLPYQFATPTSLQQCRLYTFDDYAGATQPVTIIGLIPLGTTFTLSPPTGSASYNWTANIKAGTSLVFGMFDSAGRTGGATDVLTVGASDDASCINSSSPASTITSNPASTGGAPQQAGSSGGSSSSGGIIGGAVAGVVVAVIVVGTLVWFLLRRKSRRKDTPHISIHFGRKRMDPQVDIDGTSDHHEPTSAVENYEPVPFMLPPATGRPSSDGRASEMGHYPPGSVARVSGDNEAGGSSSGAGRPSSKQTEAYRGRATSPAENTPARFILHSDAGQIDAADEEPETIELPPQYTSINGKVVRSPTYREPGPGAEGSRRDPGPAAGPS